MGKYIDIDELDYSEHLVASDMQTRALCAVIAACTLRICNAIDSFGETTSNAIYRSTMAINDLVHMLENK